MKNLKINNIPNNIKARVVDFTKESNNKDIIDAQERDKNEKYILLGMGLIVFWVLTLNYKYHKGKL
jgi:hypothetical protein